MIIGYVALAHIKLTLDLQQHKRSFTHVNH